ncbi:MAG: class IV adenylate cyclase [bacterium]|nr:class IV adenylate cyclase [bacterium]
MQTEIEAKFPDINPIEFRKLLTKVGAKQVHAEIQMCRRNFDYADRRLEKAGGWIRVRDEGSKITLAYKQLNDRTLHGTKEIEVIVDDFEKICDFLSSIGLQSKAYQETKREKWKFNDIEITIDTWPWVPTFVELEAPTEELLKETAKILSLDWDKAMHGSVETIYQMHYDFTEAEIDSWKSITFIPEPDWLLAKKK